MKEETETHMYQLYNHSFLILIHGKRFKHASYEEMSHEFCQLNNNVLLQMLYQLKRFKPHINK